MAGWCYEPSKRSGFDEFIFRAFPGKAFSLTPPLSRREREFIPFSLWEKGQG